MSFFRLKPPAARGYLIFAVCLLLFALAGCAASGATEHNAMLELRAKYIAMSEVTLSGRVSADYGDRTYDYVLSYSGDGDRGTLKVSEPAVIDGLSAVLEDGAVRFKYEGVLIDTGSLTGGLANGGISPVAAFPLFVKAWRSAYIKSSWRESYGGTPCIAGEFVLSLGSEQITLRTWFEEAGFEALHCEIYNAAGSCVLTYDK
ncbi:MAG: hypothetical protein LBN97_09360 [Oscillospiraceae bacterium]|jgi:hypothetical protein|nr:hypothetical protein [Oscillospiraceae bacterium]